MKNTVASKIPNPTNGNNINDFSDDNLVFNYLNLNKYLYNLYKQGIDNINIFLLISLEKEYYEGENLKKILLDLKDLSNNLVCEFENEKGNKEKVKFKVNKISLDVGDVLNRHRWIYRYNEEYMLKHNLTEEEQIPNNIKQEIEERAYQAGKKQGVDWFNKNFDSIRVLFPDDCIIDRNLKTEKGITQLYCGCINNPPIEYISAEFWLKHLRYETVSNALNNIRNLENSIIERSFYNEANYFLNRLNIRGESQIFPEMFLRYSKDYLAEEVIEKAILHYNENNNLEFYYCSTEPMHTTVFRGKKSQKNNTIKHYMQNELKALFTENFISIKDKIL